MQPKPKPGSETLVKWRHFINISADDHLQEKGAPDILQASCFLATYVANSKLYQNN